MAATNRLIGGDLPTIFVPTAGPVAGLSARQVRERLAADGLAGVRSMVPTAVIAALEGN